MSHAVLMKHDEALKWRDIRGRSSKHTFHPLTERQEEAWVFRKTALMAPVQGFLLVPEARCAHVPSTESD